MTLTSEYQYIGRSAAIAPTDTTKSWRYYILLYAKSIPNNDTGYHSVTIKQVLACTVVSRFWGYNTSYSGTVNGGTAFSGTKKPSEEWEITTPFTVGGLTYKVGTVIGEGSVPINCTDGLVHNIQLSTSWKFTSTSTEWFTPKTGTAVTVETSATLPPIPRATTIDSLSCSSTYIDGALTYGYTAHNTSYYSRLQIYANYKWIRTANIGQQPIAQQTDTITFTSTELETIYNAVPNAENCNIEFRITTYSDSGYSTQIGSAQSKTIKLDLPESIKPTIDLTVSPVNNNPWVASKNIYLAGFSGLQANITYTPGTGATISSTSITAGDAISTTDSLSVSTLKYTQAFNVVGTVTDSRTRKASASKHVIVFPYVAPAFSTIQYERGTWESSEWTASENGPDIKVTYKLVLSLAGLGNCGEVAFKFNTTKRDPDAGTYENVQSGVEVYAIFLGMSTETTWTLAATVTDSVGTTSSPVSITVPTQDVTIEFRANGKGIAFGKTSEKDAFECAMDAEFTGTVKFGGTVTGLPPYLCLGVADYQLTSGDLDNVRRIGSYGISTASIAQSLSNCPSTTAGVLQVLSANGSGRQDGDGDYIYILQIYIDIEGAIYIRSCSKGTGGWVFSSWRAI